MACNESTGNSGLPKAKSGGELIAAQVIAIDINMQESLTCSQLCLKLSHYQPY